MAEPKYQKKVWSERKKVVRKGDTILKDAKSSDIAILILGPSGVGKSTFINSLLGRAKVKVGHDLRACTTRIQHVILPHPRNSGQRLVLVDTPGFDIINVEDIEILRQFSVWLATSYTADTKIGGVIYLHDISSSSMDATTLKNLDIFQKLCGPDGLESFILGTTKWDLVKPAIGERREDQLVNEYWKGMIDGGSTWYRLVNTSASAWEMVNKILDVVDSKRNIGVLRLQLELVDLQKRIPDTAAGRALGYTMQQLAEMQRENFESLPARLFKSLFDAKSYKVTRTTEVNVQTKYVSQDISTVINREERITRTVDVNTSIKQNDVHQDVPPRSVNKPAAHVSNRKGDSLSESMREKDNSQPILITAGGSQADSIGSQRIPSAPAKRAMNIRVDDSVAETSLSGGYDHDVHILEKFSAPGNIALDNGDGNCHRDPSTHTAGKGPTQVNRILRASSTPVELPEGSIVDDYVAETSSDKDHSTFTKALDDSTDDLLQFGDAPIEIGDRPNNLAQRCAVVVIERKCSVETLAITETASIKSTLLEQESCDSCSKTKKPSAQTKADEDLKQSHRVTSTSVTETQTKSTTERGYFNGAHDIGIFGALMHDGDHSTVNYNHTSYVNNYNFNFQHPLDAETARILAQAWGPGKVDWGSDNTGVHIRCQQDKSDIASSSSKQM